MADERFNIRLTIAGRSFPLSIERSHEERYRRAEREVNQMIGALKKRFRADSEEDYLAMAALQLSLNNVEMELRGSMDSEEQQLRGIETQLDAYLNELK